MSNEFKRESRYIVIKKSDLEKIEGHVKGYVNSMLLMLSNVSPSLPKRKCLVIESDWPEYEPTWAAIERRVTGAPAWVGIGPPPAGTVCEIRNVAAGTAWAEATIVFASRNVIVWDWAGEPSINGLCTAYAHAVEMRPIRTPEQIEAEERDKAIEAMVELIRVNRVSLDASPESPKQEAMIAAGALYDAGYRKQEAQ